MSRIVHPAYIKNYILRPNLRKNLHSASNSVRSYLSPAFQCQDAWNSRLTDELIQQDRKPTEYYIEMMRQFKTENIIWALDVDLYLQSLASDGSNFNFEDVEELLSNIRASRQMFSLLQSSHHQVARMMLSTGHINSLFRIISQPIKYGIFTDRYTSVMLMDHFLQKEDYQRSARVASRLMQSCSNDWKVASADATESLERSFILHSALSAAARYKEDDQAWKDYEVVAPLWDESSGEEMPEKVRIDYHANPFFDDHFDLCCGRALIGKTLVERCYAADLTKGALRTNTLLTGYAMWQKWDNVTDLVEKMKKGEEETQVGEGTMALVRGHLELSAKEEGMPGTVQHAIENNLVEFPIEYKHRVFHLMDLPADGLATVSRLPAERKDASRAALDTLPATSDYDPALESEQILIKTVQDNEQAAIQQQDDVFKKWATDRQSRYELHMKDKRKIELEDKISEKKKHLKTKSQLITYFDNENKMHLIMDTVGKFEHPFPRTRPKQYSRIRKTKLDEQYIPPMVKSKRNVK